MLLSSKGDSWLKWTLTLGSSSTTVWKENVKAWKHLANSDGTDFFRLLEEIYIYFDVRKYWESSRQYVFEG